MSKAQTQGHTPGPWNVEPQQERGHYWIRSTVPQRALGGKHAVAETIPHAVPYDEAEANARLIAAAPVLLAAAKAALGSNLLLGDTMEAIDLREQLQAAIREAQP